MAVNAANTRAPAGGSQEKGSSRLRQIGNGSKYTRITRSEGERQGKRGRGEQQPRSVAFPLPMSRFRKLAHVDASILASEATTGYGTYHDVPKKTDKCCATTDCTKTCLSKELSEHASDDDPKISIIFIESQPALSGAPSRRGQ